MGRKSTNGITDHAPALENGGLVEEINSFKKYQEVNYPEKGDMIRAIFKYYEEKGYSKGDINLALSKCYKEDSFSDGGLSEVSDMLPSANPMSVINPINVTDTITPMKYGGEAQKKFDKVMGEYWGGTLKHGTTGKIVPKSRQDIALAIAFSEAHKIDPKFEIGGAVSLDAYDGFIETLIFKGSSSGLEQDFTDKKVYKKDTGLKKLKEVRADADYHLIDEVNEEYYGNWIFELRHPTSDTKADQIKFETVQFFNDGGVAEGFHQMPDGQIMADSVHQLKDGGSISKKAKIVMKNQEIKDLLAKKGTDRMKYSESELQSLSNYSYNNRLDNILVNKMWGLVKKHGFDMKNSMIQAFNIGNGDLLRYVPDSVRKVDAFDRDSDLYMISKLLFANDTIKIHKSANGFTKRYDLSIGICSKLKTIVAPAVVANIKKGGLLVAVVDEDLFEGGADSANQREILNNKFELLEAYKLPSDIMDGFILMALKRK